MSLLEKVRSGKALQPPRLLIYGTEGIGKSTLAAGSEGVIFVQTEDGLAGLDCDRFPLAASYGEVLTALDELAKESHDYQSIALDSLSALERLIFDEVCRASGVASIEKADGGYGKGYTHALNYWREALSRLDHLRNHRGMAIVLIAHAKVERYEDPEFSAYDRYAPRLHKHASALITEWCDCVLFATRKRRMQSEDAGFGRKRTIAHALGRDGGERVLRAVGSPSCVAKNRFSLPEELPLSWDALMVALSQAHSKENDNHG